MPQTTYTHGQGAVLMTNALGSIRKHLTDRPTATPFRYTSVRFTVFGQAWFFEDFDQGTNSAYLGNRLVHTASRNCDGRGLTMFRMERPGIGNYQSLGTSSTGSPAAIDNAEYGELLHRDLVDRYNDIAAAAYGLSEDGRVGDIDVGFTQATDSANFARSRTGQPYYTDGFAWAAIDEVEYHIGGQRMDKHDGDVCYLWHLLNCAGEGVPNKMTGLAYSRDNNDLELKRDSMTYGVKYAPLCFPFCRSPAMMAPLISTMYNSLSLHVKFRGFSELICNYSGAGLNGAGGTSSVVAKGAYTVGAASLWDAGTIAIPDGTQFWTRKRVGEDTLANSRLRGKDVVTVEHQGFAATTSVGAVTASNLVQTDFPVSVVSMNYFLGPGERAAFASSSFYQIVEACQRLSMSTTSTTQLQFRTDQFQNAASALYVVPKWPANTAANDHFAMGGAWDHIRGRSQPAISQMEFITNGAVQFQLTDESFFRHVQSFAHHSRVPTGDRLAYSMNFGMKANGRGPVQCIGYINLSRTTNSTLNIHFMQNVWTRDTTTDSAAQAVSHYYGDVSTASMTIKLVLFNYNIQQYIGGIAGYKYTQVNMSV